MHQFPCRLNKFIAHAGFCSRRAAEALIFDGRVSINGIRIKNYATMVLENDAVMIDQQQLQLIQKIRLWKYHKIKGLITTHNDPYGRRNVFESLPKNLPRVVSIGRLDYNTEGLLLLTNSPTLAHLLEKPNIDIVRKYRCRAFGKISAQLIAEMRRGVKIGDLQYGSIIVEKDTHDDNNNVWLTISLTEGKNREIRNVMQHFGLEVTRLIRIQYGKFCLNDLEKNAIMEVAQSNFNEYLSLCQKTKI